MVAGAGALALGLTGLVGVAVLGAVESASASTSSGALNTSALPSSARSYVPWLVEAGSLCPQITAPLLAAQIQAESGWDPTALSPTGASGLSQFEPGTWPSWSQPPAVPGPDVPTNPSDAIMAQGRYMCALAAQMAPLAQSSGVDVVSLALAAYNAGPAAVVAAGGIPRNGQTPAYVRAIEASESTYTLATLTAAGGTAFGMRVVQAAAAELGRPYSWGGGTGYGPSLGIGSGAGTVGFDCSGLALFAIFQASGGAIALPHSSEVQVTMGTPVPLVAAAPGDLVFFALGGGSDYDHVGVVIGDGQMIDAPYTGVDVRVDTYSSWGVPMQVRSYG